MEPTYFPERLDTFNDIGAQPVDLPNPEGEFHSFIHTQLRSALFALEEKVGVDNSSDPTSIDYKVGILPLVGTGRITIPETGFWTDLGPAAIWRLKDRVFVGDAADTSGQWAATTSESWVATDIAYWPERSSQFMSASTVGGIAGCFASRTSDYNDAHPAAAIGVAGFSYNDNATPGLACWSGYFEAVRTALSLSAAYGLEITSKNQSTDVTSTPYLTLGWGCIGIWLPAGGDDSYGGASTNPSNCAIMIGKNSQPWNKGIIFRSDGITGTDGSGTGTGIAIDLAAGHVINWTGPTGGTSATIYSKSTTAAQNMGIVFEDNSIRFTGHAGVSAYRSDHIPGAVNYLTARNALTGVAPSFVAAGDDTDVDIGFTPKGAGLMKFGTFSANSDTPIIGYISIKDAGGTTRKLAVIA
jgi:hypothetical protein